MKILVLNAGSSSLKFGVFDLARIDSRVFKGEFERFEDGKAILRYRVGGEAGQELKREEPVPSLTAAVARVPALLEEFDCADIHAIGHRVVHGGERFRSTALIDEEMLVAIEQCSDLAPMHNPVALLTILSSQEQWPSLPQAAVFDTAFHQSMPEHVYTYAIPQAWRQLGLRRYGFHGTSHHYVALRAAEALERPIQELRLLSCHLGNGASVCAISHGQSLDTSMGMTPLEGLVMGTRSGDVDPGLFAFLQHELGIDAVTIEQQLQNASGLLALCGNADMRSVEEHAAAGDKSAQLALKVYAYRVRKYLGAYAAAMGGVDAVVFTGGIGENSAGMRQRICERLEFLGLYLDTDLNNAPDLDNFAVSTVSAPDSQIQVLVTRTNEQFMIAREVQQILQAQQSKPALSCRIPVKVSARHVHLSQRDVEALFGEGHQLQLDHELSQIEGWAAAEHVELVGPKGSFANVIVLGPARSATQIEVSRTDCIALGIDAPLRDSGDLQGTPTVRLRGPAGEIDTDGVIIAARHIHMSPADGSALGLSNGDRVDMRIGSGARALSFANTLVRIKPSYATEMHIDTDEANAAGIRAASDGELIVKTGGPDADIVALSLSTTSD